MRSLSHTVHISILARTSLSAGESGLDHTGSRAFSFPFACCRPPTPPRLPRHPLLSPQVGGTPLSKPWGQEPLQQTKGAGAPIANQGGHLFSFFVVLVFLTKEAADVWYLVVRDTALLPRLGPPTKQPGTHAIRQRHELPEVRGPPSRPINRSATLRE